MSRHRSLLVLAAVALSTATLGACSKSSPTEPSPLADLEAASLSSSSSSMTGITDESRHGGRGGDDGSADDNGGSRRGRGRGADDAAGDDRGGRRGGRGRGADDAAGDDRGGRGGGRGRGADDGTPRAPRAPRAGQQFEGAVVAVTGQTLTLAGGTRVVVDGQTQWNARGDLFSLAQVERSVASGDPTRVEGRGTRQGGGTLVALTLKAEVDN
jgi:hypothetical protein